MRVDIHTRRLNLNRCDSIVGPLNAHAPPDLTGRNTPLKVEFRIREKRALKSLIALLVAVVAFGWSGAAWSQSLPPEVITPYVAYTEALEDGRTEEARDAAREAWRSAERAELDAMTVATLSDNYAGLALSAGEYDRAVDAYRTTAQLLAQSGANDYIVAETWMYAAHAALTGQDYREAQRCADAAGDIAENADNIDADARAAVLFNSRAIQATANWSNGNLRAAHRRSNEAMEAAGQRDFSQNTYYPLLTFVLGATSTLLDGDEDAAYWLTLAYHHFDAQRQALRYWSDYARNQLDEDEREALLERLAQVDLPEVVLDEESQDEADEAAEREAMIASGDFVDAVPVSRPLPTYPIDAAAAGSEGTAVIRFNVNEDGETEDIEVLISIPFSDFGEASARAVRRWEYSPALESGEPRSRTGMVTHFNFVLAE